MIWIWARRHGLWPSKKELSKLLKRITAKRKHSALEGHSPKSVSKTKRKKRRRRISWPRSRYYWRIRRVKPCRLNMSLALSGCPKASLSSQTRCKRNKIRQLLDIYSSTIMVR